MARVTIDLPSEFRFSTNISIRITDINYGGHAGNDTILSLIHEARMQFLSCAGYTEMDCGGNGLIMTDASIEFKKELFYNEIVTISVVAANFSKISFELYYKMEKQVEGKTVLVTKVKTSMVCFNYTTKKVAAFPPEVVEKLTTA
jgi:acyl-CoA thioester hydrolase